MKSPWKNSNLSLWKRQSRKQNLHFFESVFKLSLLIYRKFEISFTSSFSSVMTSNQSRRFPRMHYRINAHTNFNLNKIVTKERTSDVNESVGGASMLAVFPSCAREFLQICVKQENNKFSSLFWKTSQWIIVCVVVTFFSLF